MLFRDIKKHLATLDWYLIILVLIALGLGFLAIKSATNFYLTSPLPKNQMRNLTVQAAATFIGLNCIWVLSKSDYMHILKHWKYLLAFSILFLIAVLIFGEGSESGGTQRNWLKFMGVGIQPSEVCKIFLILIMAHFLDRYKENINNPKVILIICIPFVIFFGLVVASGDLGNSLMYFCIFASMCFAAGISLWYFLGGAFIIAALSPLLWNLMRPDQQMRILVGFNPMLDPSGKGYHALRSMHAIGSGGLFGKGYQQGPITQRIQPHIPEQWTDFIFSAIGEEFGFVGAIFVLSILTLIIVRIFIIAKNARNTVGSLICVGVMSMFIAQIVENIGMCLGMLPVIGITLPFISYGGSSVLSSLLGIGMVLSVNSRKNIYYFTRDENLDKY